MFERFLHASPAAQRQAQCRVGLREVGTRPHHSLQVDECMVRVFGDVQRVQPSRELRLRQVRLERERSFVRLPGRGAVLWRPPIWRPRC